MKYGYARVSTNGQEHALQLDALRKAGVAEGDIYQDTITGVSDPYRRPQLSRLLSSMTYGDELIVWRLDRLGRNAKDLLIIDETLKKRGVKLVSLQEGVNTATPAGQFFYNILASMAQMEREIINERVKAGMETARKKGKKFGRPRLLTEDIIRQIHALHGAGEPVRKIMGSFNLSERTVYRALEIAPTYKNPQLSILEVIGSAADKTPAPEAKKYYYKGKVIEVIQGLWTGENGMPVYFSGWKTEKGRHRVKSKNLPPESSETEAQRKLDAWAQEKRLEEAE